MSEESHSVAGVTILAFCQLNGKMVYAEISGHTYEAMTRAVERLCFRNKAELIKAAFEKYGVSEGAIERYLSEFAGRKVLMTDLKPALPTPVCVVCHQPIKIPVIKECPNCGSRFMVCSNECKDKLKECRGCF